MAEHRRRHHGDVGTDHERFDDVGAAVDAGGGGDRDVGAELRAQDGDPSQGQSQLAGLAQLDAIHDLERVEIEVGLVEAVEEHEPVGTGSRRRLGAKLAMAE